MSTLIRTDHVPTADLVDFLREVMARTWLPMECRPERRTDYCAEFRASGLGPMQVVVMDVPPATVKEFPPEQVKWCFEKNDSSYVVGGATCPVCRQCEAQGKSN